MIIERNNYIKFIPENDFEKSQLINLLNNKCIRTNPQYLKMLKKNFTKGIAKQIKTFKQINDYFIIHKGNYEVYNLVLNSFHVSKIRDYRVSNKISVKPNGGPRDEEQKKAIENIYNWFICGFGYGCLNAPPASGKTFQAINLFARLQEKTLVVIDMKLLLEQFIDSILYFTNLKKEDIGIIGEGKMEYKDKKIIIATAQTLIDCKDLMKTLSKEIGFLIIDEVHVASSNTFQKIIPNFRPKFQLGLSGSHDRDDGMDFLVKEAVGPIIHTIEREALIKAGSIITPFLRPIFLKDDLKFKKYNEGRIEFRDVINEYYNCPKAINKISNIIIHYYNENRSQLLICKEKTMVEAYYFKLLEKLVGIEFINKCFEEKNSIINKIQIDIENLLKEDLKNFSTKKDLKLLEKKEMTLKQFKDKYQKKKDKKINELCNEKNKIEKKNWFDTNLALENDLLKTIAILTGTVSSKERNRIIEETNSGKIKILISTTVMDKAVSISRLDTLHLLYSTRERANTIQRVGRISRTFKGKENAVVFDYIYDHYMSFYQYNNGSGECRMTVHSNYTIVPKENELFIKYLRTRFNKEFKISRKENDEFLKVYKKFILDLN